MVLQLLGIGCTAGGVVAVRDWFASTADAAAGLTRGVARSVALRTDRLGRWWGRRRGRPVVVGLSGSATATSSASGTATVIRHRVDRAAVSDREWLADLDDRLAALQVRCEEAALARTAEHRDGEDRRRNQREELRGEILAGTRQGWQLILVGLACSALGTVVGAIGS